MFKSRYRELLQSVITSLLLILDDLEQIKAALGIDEKNKEESNEDFQSKEK